MNLQISKILTAHWLPRALEGKQGQVDSAFLETLWQCIPRRSSKIRALIKDFGVALSPKDSAIDKLAELLVDPSFLSRWLTHESKAYPTINQLIWSYFDANEKSLSFDSLTKMGVLVKQKVYKNIYFPEIGKVPDLVEALYNAKLDKRYLSLFIWKKLIGAQIAKLKYPGEQSLQVFGEVFISALKERGLEELILGASDTNWNWVVPIDLELDSNTLASDPNAVKKTEPVPHPVVRKCLLSQELAASVEVLEESVQEYKALSASLLAKAKVFAGEDEPVTTLKQIAEYAKSLEALYQEIKSSAGNLIDRVGSSLAAGLSKVGVSIEEDEFAKFSLSDSQCWFESVDRQIEENSIVFSLLDRFEDEEVVKKLHDRNGVSSGPFKYGELKDVLEALYGEYLCVTKGLEAEKKFIETIKGNLHRLDWNVFQDVELSADDWLALAKYYILTECLGTRLGITVQQTFNNVSETFGRLLVAQISNGSKSDVTVSINTLSWLTLMQQEQLARSHPGLKTLVALSQLEAYFKAVNQNFDYYIYWSTSPLSEISNTHSSLIVRSFFKSIYDIISSQGSKPLSLQSLAMCVSSAQIGNAKRQNAKASLDTFVDELKNILAFRKKGGRTTYAHIWQAAYNDIFEPLLECLNSRGHKEFVEDFERWESDFYIEGHFDAWKSEIPDHLKKNSEYDKFLRTQVYIKVSEISDWISIYKSVTQNALVREDDQLADFKLTIDKILKSSGQDCAVVRVWLESKASDQKASSNSYVCQNLGWNESINCIASFNEGDVYHPRAFAKILNEPVSYEVIYTDDLVADFGFGATEHLVELYAANELFEGYAVVANDSNEDIAPALDRKVEKLTEELASKLKQRIHLLDAIRTHPSLENTLISANDHVENQQWRQAEITISLAEEIAIDIDKTTKVIEQRNELLSKIERLGGHAEAGVDVENSKLYSIVESLLLLHKEKRAHISVLEKLSALSATGFERQLEECLEYLDCYERYPSASVAEQVAYYLEQAVDPICSELSRSRTLLATYVSQLKKLGRSLLVNVRHDKNLFSDNSNLISILVDTADQWQRISSDGKAGVDSILKVFVSRGILESEDILDTGETVIKSPELLGAPAAEKEVESFSALKAKAREVIAGGDGLNVSRSDEIKDLIYAKAWSEVSKSSLAKLAVSNYESSEDLENWAVSTALNTTVHLDCSELSSIVRMVNSKISSSVIRFLHQDKVGRQLVGDLVSRLIVDMARSLDLEALSEKEYSQLDALQVLSSNIPAAIVHQDTFRNCFEVDVFETVALKAYWEKFTGDQKQAEARALFMFLAWRFHSSRALAYCLTLSPIDLEKRKAEALAKVAEDALVSGNSDLLQGFFDLKKSIQAKPFQIFADLVLSNSMSHGENAAKLTLLGGLERHSDGSLRSVLRIEPRRVDSPDSITLKLPNNCPVRFSNNTATEKLNGPFFTDTSLPIAFILLDEQAVTFSVELACSVVSLTGSSSSFNQKIEFSIASDTEFEPLTPDEIDDDFENFPDAHMRGENYVPRVVDEQKIEKALFKSKTVRSLWISSPRRSGKTTMLYRILDAFSHKVNRDNLVVYLTLDESFTDSTTFNRWIWRRLRTFAPNRELRELYDDFEAVGRDLPFDSDTGSFIGELSSRLLSVCEAGARIIFLIDEIDRFAAMYFEGGGKRNTAVDILWQIRHTVTDRRDIGIVFAGSSAAKQVFIADAASPFYNSIDHLELTPFSCKNKVMEDASRQIVEPHRIRFKYNLPKDTLEHLVWVCAGIPYYMKLVAGATYATAKQSHILKADVNEGLRALLGRATGISKLDEMGGDPGSDDLRTTISIEKSSEGVLAKAVLYSFADLHSPISGHKTYRGKISSAESRLVSHYNLTKVQIDRGLDICIGLGLIRMIETESVPEIDFVIPILGESLRKSSGRLWANIDHELISLGQGRG